MEKLKQAKHFINIWMAERWYREKRITASFTDNVLIKDFEVKGVRYHFECREYCYTISSDKWYLKDKDYYVYRVIMSDGETTTTGTYPLLSTYHVKTYQYWHHLAIRAHIQEHVR